MFSPVNLSSCMIRKRNVTTIIPISYFENLRNRLSVICDNECDGITKMHNFAHFWPCDGITVHVIPSQKA